MKIYRVGGFVRDKLLGLQPHDCDYVVVGGSIEEMLKLGFRQIGNFFPVFLHPQSAEEYALARSERKKGLGHQGFAIEHGRQVTLEEDLLRRDLTINAIAEDANGDLIDPYGGIDDLNKHILRHVSAAFSEDPLRILRVARFAAKLNFSIAAETWSLLSAMAKTQEGLTISRERVINELERALAEKYSWRFFEVLAQSANLAVFFPSLAKSLAQPEELNAFIQDLRSCPTIHSKYVILAIYLSEDGAALSQLSLNKSTLKFLRQCQLLHYQLQKELSDSQILALVKKTDGLRNFKRFSELCQSYRHHLQQRQQTKALARLKLLELISVTLSCLPISKLQDQNPSQQQLAAAIAAWQLTTIHNLRN